MKKNMNLFTGIIIGICVVIIPLLLMGSTTVNYDNELGRYQVSTTGVGSNESMTVYETIIDTKTGRITSRERRNYQNYSKKGSY